MMIVFDADVEEEPFAMSPVAGAFIRLWAGSSSPAQCREMRQYLALGFGTVYDGRDCDADRAEAVADFVLAKCMPRLLERVGADRDYVEGLRDLPCETAHRLRLQAVVALVREAAAESLELDAAHRDMLEAFVDALAGGCRTIERVGVESKPVQTMVAVITAYKAMTSFAIARHDKRGREFLEAACESIADADPVECWRTLVVDFRPAR